MSNPTGTLRRRPRPLAASLSFALVAAGALLWPAAAQAASCSLFAVVSGYDEADSSVTLQRRRGNERRFFPKPEGDVSGSRIPKKCSGRILSADSFPVKATGGRLSITQIRSNFEGKMQNDTDDPEWLPTELNKLIADKTKVVVVLRPPPGKEEPYGVTTIYLPITDEERAEIERRENEGEDVD